MELPAGWAWATLADVLSEPLINGRSVKTMDGGFPVLRLTALKRGGVDLSEHKDGAWRREQATPFLVSEGDFLLSRGNGSLKLVGRGALVRHVSMDTAFPDTMIRVRTRPEVITPEYLAHIWDSSFVRGQIEKAARTTAGIHKINQEILEGTELPVPPLAEQHRIVEALDDHLSRLDVAAASVKRCNARAGHMWGSVLNSVAEGTLRNQVIATETLPISTVAEVSGGIQKQAKRRPVQNVFPFLRVANVARGKLDLSEIHQIELFDGELEKHQLERGDLLVVEGNGSPDQIGRAASWHGEIANAVHQNHLIRVRPGQQLAPRYLELIWNSPLVINQLREVARSTSGLYTLSTSKVKAVRIPVPSIQEQQFLAEEADMWETYTLAARTSLQRAGTRGQSLRRAILTRAFSGQLVPQDPADEPASLLLDRLRAERIAQGSKPSRTRRPRKTATPPPPPSSSTPIPPTAVQQEFEL